MSDAAVMTIKDFILESEAFPYSKENYDLVKECSEIDLMYQYIESQKFYQENSVLVNDITFTEGFFMESVDEDKLQLLEEKAGEKLDNLLERAKKFLDDLIEKFINFLYKILQSSSKLDEKCKKISEVASTTTFSPEMEKDLIGAVEAAASKCGFQFPSHYSKGDYSTQPWLKKVHDAKTKNIIAGLAKGTVTVLPGDKWDKAVLANNLKNLFDKNDIQKGILSPSVESGLKAQAQLNAKGIAIDFYNDGINKAISELKDIQSALKKDKKEQSKGIDSSLPKENFAAVRVAIGQTMNLYSTAHRFRSIVLDSVLKIVSNPAPAADEGAAEKPAKEKAEPKKEKAKKEKKEEPEIKVKTD